MDKTLATTTAPSVREESHALGGRAWLAALAALAAVRIVIPLVALAASGHDLPAIPRYDYEPLLGDANGYYATARELISTAAGLPGLVAALVLAAGAYALIRLGRTWIAVGAGALAVSLTATVIVLAMEPSGAPVVGWPLILAVPLAPLRVVGALDADSTFAVGLVVSLAANAATVVAAAYLGLWASGRRWIGITAAALFAIWPLLTMPLAGTSAWENGQWLVDVGLALYTEPLSTALVTIALALVLSPRADEFRLALAGALLGFATVVKLSNGVIAAVIVAWVLWGVGARRAAVVAIPGAAFAPVVAAYWPKGYASIPNSTGFSLDMATRSWVDSLLFDPKTLLVLAPLAIFGGFALRRWTASLLVGVILANALFYSLYVFTPLHPRFLYVTLPALFVLEAAGAGLAIRKSSEGIRGRGL